MLQSRSRNTPLSSSRCETATRKTQTSSPMLQFRPRNNPLSFSRCKNATRKNSAEFSPAEISAPGTQLSSFGGKHAGARNSGEFANAGIRLPAPRASSVPTPAPARRDAVHEPSTRRMPHRKSTSDLGRPHAGELPAPSAPEQGRHGAALAPSRDRSSRPRQPVPVAVKMPRVKTVFDARFRTPLGCRSERRWEKRELVFPGQPLIQLLWDWSRGKVSDAIASAAEWSRTHA